MALPFGTMILMQFFPSITTNLTSALMWSLFVIVSEMDFRVFFVDATPTRAPSSLRPTVMIPPAVL